MLVRTISSDIAGRLEQAPTSTRSGVSPLPRQSENSVDVRAASLAPKESSFTLSTGQSACPQKAHAKEDALALPLRAKKRHGQKFASDVCTAGPIDNLGLDCCFTHSNFQSDPARAACCGNYCVFRGVGIDCRSLNCGGAKCRVLRRCYSSFASVC